MSDATPIRLTEARPLPGFRPWFGHSDCTDDLLAPDVITVDDSFARGFEAGHQHALAAFTEERAQLLALIGACQALQPEASDDLAALIAAAVEELVHTVVGEVEIDRDLLLSRALRAAALVKELDGEKFLYVHSGDLPLLAELGGSITLRGDDMLSRGSIRIETQCGWVEDGVTTHLDLLKEQLRLEGPQE